MDEFSTDADVQWLKEGLSYTRTYSDYPYRDSSRSVDTTDFSSKLPRVLSDCSQDVTPKPLFPVFLRAGSTKEKAATDADGTSPDMRTVHEAGDATMKMTADARDVSELEGLEAFVLEEEQEEERQRREKQRELQLQQAKEELARTWVQDVEEEETWKHTIQLLLPADEDVSERKESTVDEDKEWADLEESREKLTVYTDDTGAEGVNGTVEAQVEYETRSHGQHGKDERVHVLAEASEQEHLGDLKDEDLEDSARVKDVESYHKEWKDITMQLRSIVFPAHSHRRPTNVAVDSVEPDSIPAVVEEEEFEEIRHASPSGTRLAPVEFSRKDIILSESDTVVLLDQPDTVVMPEWPEYRKVVDRNEAYDLAVERRRTENTSANASAQTSRPELIDRQVYTGPMPALTECGGMIDEYCLYETYAKEQPVAVDKTERSDTALVKGVELNDYESFIKYLEANEKEYMPVLYYFEKTMNQNSYGELLAACNKPESAVETASDAEEDVDPLTATCPLPNLQHLLAISPDVFKGKKHSVTCICFNYMYPHFFAAGFEASTRNRNEHGEPTAAAPSGYVICWDMAHFQVPEVFYDTPEVVTCVEFSRSNPCLLAVGMRNGLLAVFDISNAENNPSASNYCSTERPYGNISRVRWLDQPSGDISGHSSSLVCATSDGKLYQWYPGASSRFTYLRGSQDKSRPTKRGQDDGADAMHAVNIPYLCLDLNPTDPNVFVIGTVTGEIMQCDMSGQVIRKHTKHCGPVYEVKWSWLVDGIFISCGFDSAICLWDSSRSEPERVFYVRHRDPVVHVCWSSTSSTLFAAVTSAKIKIYDLSQSRVGELLERQTQKFNEELTCVTFFPYGNWFFVGRSDGVIDVFDVRNVALSHDDPEKALRSAFL